MNFLYMFYFLNNCFYLCGIIINSRTANFLTKIDYDEKFKEKKLQNPIITEVFSIPKEHFEEEDEYRFFNCKDGKPYNYTDEGRKKVLPESAFSELIISHQMPPKNRKELLECAARTMPNVPIFEAKIINPNVEFTRIK